ncbi:hypothetical protein MRX96_004931 [Rhipicephalus microplus]
MCIYYRLAHPECLPFEKAANGVWDVDSGFLDCFSHLHLEKGAVEREKENGSINHSLASMPLSEELYSRFEDENRKTSESEKGSSVMETQCKTKGAEQLLWQRKCSGSGNNIEEPGERNYWSRDEECADPADCSMHGLTLEKQWDALADLCP